MNKEASGQIKTIVEGIAERVVLRATKEILGQAVLNLMNGDGHSFSKRPCTTCQTISEIVEQPFGCVKKALGPQASSRTEFLYPYEDGSIEEAGYEFANGLTEAYRKQWWDILVTRIKEDGAAKHR